MKNILRKNEGPYVALLSYRNTPLSCGASPAQLLLGRTLIILRSYWVDTDQHTVTRNRKFLQPLPENMSALKQEEPSCSNTKENVPQNETNDDTRRQSQRNRKLPDKLKDFIVD